MQNYVSIGSIKIAEILYQFVNVEVLPEVDLDIEQFWSGFEKLMNDLAPKNKRLLEERQHIQKQMNEWYQHNKTFTIEDYKQFLEGIGYLEPVVNDFKVELERVDEEIAQIAGPQLVVPINNPRYAINAANARWGSLYDAFYGTDVISEQDGAEKTSSYNPIRGNKVIEKSKQFLDKAVPLKNASHKDAIAYKLQNNGLVVSLKGGETVRLRDRAQLVGYQGNKEAPTSILLKNNGLHIDIQFDAKHPIGKTDQANMKDIIIESAITSIMDCEDSVAAVDAMDKVDVYRNWKGLIRGDLSTTFKKGNQTIERTFHDDRLYQTLDGKEIALPGRVLMLVRNVGHLMTNNAVLLADGTEAYEGILDGVFTSLIAMHNLQGKGKYINSKAGSIYIVKPKMHGSKEVAFADELFARIEDLLGLQRNTLKIGIMDEERRTSLNLKNCIHAAKERVIFINTGFLDRTGDEIHTSMEAGPMVRKADMKHAAWLHAYEKSNVNIGLSTGFKDKAQIGKGMWAMPDKMADMVREKIGHVVAGANTAWVPSPTAATLHALHYHERNVSDIQDDLLRQGVEKDYREGILQIPIEKHPDWTGAEIQKELDNNTQTMLGYVVRWVEQGVGCSKVPDINDVGLMEDRATLRISSQLIANWLHHGICHEEQVMETLKRMAKVVDRQNKNDQHYRNMSPHFDESIAFQAACDLVFKGLDQPNGYTEPILHRRRLEFKEKNEILN